MYRNKLESLVTSTLVKCWQIRPEPTRVKPLTGLLFAFHLECMGGVTKHSSLLWLGINSPSKIFL